MFMNPVTKEQIRRYRLHTHHLDTWYPKKGYTERRRACGFQNSPPGAWENALHNRVAECTLQDMKGLLEVEKRFADPELSKGAPVVLPLESDAFISALIPESDEP